MTAVVGNSGWCRSCETFKQLLFHKRYLDLGFGLCLGCWVDKGVRIYRLTDSFEGLRIKWLEPPNLLAPLGGKICS